MQPSKSLVSWLMSVQQGALANLQGAVFFSLAMYFCTSGSARFCREQMARLLVDQPVKGIGCHQTQCGEQNTVRCRNRQWEQDLQLGGCDGAGRGGGR
ncbi:hypothetical protein F5Y10DRAFT_245049 [Nemania abortiva]|nr:hypothetical protein F5Y10DRAFT_245049 [Nemania abortiva]